MNDQASGSSPRQVQVKIEIPADLKAIYANFSVISHSPSEVFLDVAQIMLKQSKARVQVRVVMTPLNAKLLHRALGENIAKYETQFGEIKIPDHGSALAREFFSARPPDPEGEQ